jgi:hypothetical protein
MAVIVRVDDLLPIRSRAPDEPPGAADVEAETAPAPPTDTPDEPPIPLTEIDFTDPDPPADTAEHRRKWGVALLLAIRDDASSVQYQSWREDGTLAYISHGTRHILYPPSSKAAREFAAAARAIVKPGWRGLLARVVWWLGGAVAGRFTLDIGYGVTVVWDVVIWSSGERFGVDFFRVSPLDADVTPNPSQAQEAAT